MGRATNRVWAAAVDDDLPALTTFLREGTEAQRDVAARALREYVPDSLAVLIEALDDPSERVRLTIADVLAASELSESADGFLRALDDPSEKVRLRVVEHLRDREGDEALVGLLRALDDPSEKVRLRIVDHLRDQETDEALVGLLRALEDRSVKVRRAAGVSLASSFVGQRWFAGPPRAGVAPAALARLEVETDEEVRRHLWFVLAREPEKIPDLEPLVAVASDAERPLADRRSALKALAATRNETVALGVALRCLEDPDLIENAIDALGSFSDERALAALDAIEIPRWRFFRSNLRRSGREDVAERLRPAGALPTSHAAVTPLATAVGVAAAVHYAELALAVLAAAALLDVDVAQTALVAAIAWTFVGPLRWRHDRGRARRRLADADVLAAPHPPIAPVRHVILGEAWGVLIIFVVGLSGAAVAELLVGVGEAFLGALIGVVPPWTFIQRVAIARHHERASGLRIYRDAAPRAGAEPRYFAAPDRTP